MKKRGQAALEYLYLLGLVLFVSLFVILVVRYFGVQIYLGSSSSARNAISCIPTDIGPGTSGLAASWHFEEGAGSSALDSSGNNNNADTYGPTWVEGVRGKGMLFNRETEDYLKVSSSPSLDSSDSKSLSVLFWIKTYDHSVETGLFEKDGQSDGGFLIRQFTDGRLRVRMKGGTGVFPNDFFSDAELQDNQWYHVAMVYDYAAQKRRWYINGVLDLEEDTSGELSPSPGEDLLIGKRQNQFFNGVLDEVKIYSRSLSKDEIAADIECAPWRM